MHAFRGALVMLLTSTLWQGSAQVFTSYPTRVRPGASGDGPWPTCDGSTGEPSCGSFAATPLAPRNLTAVPLDLEIEAVPVEVILDDIFRVLELGKAEIELSEKNITLVMGMTGSGRSTLCAFVAGDYCRLYANLTDLGVVIWDKDSITINDTIISRTLLPRLVIDEQTQSALYDTQGYSDTRNESVEIGHSFFLKKIIDYADRVKITVVISHSQLHPIDRHSFIKLLAQLAVFIRNPEKLTNSIAIVSTNVIFTPFAKEWDILNRYRCFFALVRNELPQLWPAGPLRTRALQILSILEVQIEGQLTRAGMFFQPPDLGCLDEIPEMQCNKANLRHLILEKVNYADTTEEDFGYGLSHGSASLIPLITRRLDMKIGEILYDLSSAIEENFLVELSATQGDEPDLLTRLVGLKSSMYPLSNSSSSTNPATYRDEIIQTMGTFAKVDFDLSNLIQQFEILHFFYVANEGMPLDLTPRTWIVHLLAMKERVLAKIVGRCFVLVAE